MIEKNDVFISSVKYGYSCRLVMSTVIVALTALSFVALNVFFMPSLAEASHNPETENCDADYARGLIWALDNTETIRQEANLDPADRREPFGNPDVGTSGTRIQIPVNFGSNITTPHSRCPMDMPSPNDGTQQKIAPGNNFRTPSCPIISGCITPYIVPFMDVNSYEASNVSIGAPSTVWIDGVRLHHVASTWEDGQGSFAEDWESRRLSMTRNFPTNRQLNDMQTRPESGHPDRRWFRLLIHYADCTDDGVLELFPGICPPPPGDPAPDPEPDPEPEPDPPPPITFTVDRPRAQVRLDNNESPSSGEFSGRFRLQRTPIIIGDTRRANLDTELDYYIERGDEQIPIDTVSQQGNYRVSVSSHRVDTADVTLGELDIRFGDQICVVFTVTPSTGTITSSGLNTNTSGTVASEPACTTIVGLPYVSAFGADVVAGNGFAGSCDPANSGFINALFNSDPSSFSGSGAQFAVQAMDEISGFASAKMRGTPPAPPKGLTFANVGAAPASEPYGGGFSVAHCVRDWYALADEARTGGIGNVQAIFNSANNNPAGVTVRELDSETMGNNTRQLNNGRQLVIIRQGDLYIRQNLTYSNNSWSSVNEIPSLYVIVRGGNIYIDNDVTQLDGIYIAQPSGGSGGNIYTCAAGVRDPIDIVNNPGSAADDCGNQLTVNGAFIASTVKFNRAFSSQVSGSQGEYVYGSNRACRVGGAAGGTVDRPLCAAEVINFSPEIFLAPSPFQSDLPPVPRGTYDSVISLPPVL